MFSMSSPCKSPGTLLQSEIKAARPVADAWGDKRPHDPGVPPQRPPGMMPTAAGKEVQR